MFVSFTASHCSSRTYSFPLSNTESTKSQSSHVQPAFALRAHSSIADTLWVSIHQSISDLPLLDHLAIERWHINLTSCSSSARGHRRRLGNQIQPFLKNSKYGIYAQGHHLTQLMKRRIFDENTSSGFTNSITEADFHLVSIKLQVFVAQGWGVAWELNKLWAVWSTWGEKYYYVDGSVGENEEEVNIEGDEDGDELGCDSRKWRGEVLRDRCLKLSIRGGYRIKKS
jgi:hypothetical protein